MDPERKKLEELAARIHQAEAKPEAGLEPETRSGRNAGYDFAGTVIGSVILGLLLDRFFGTAPWILLAPGIFLALLLVSLNVLGDGLRDAFDVREPG